MQPKIYLHDDHQINAKNIDPHVFYIIEKLKQNGHKAYLVGGSVRDLLLKAVPKDFDISTSAKPDEIKSIFRNCILIGKRFRLAHIRFGRKIFEVSTFRSGDTTSSEIILKDNEWGDEKEDVLRRDFTINGLFYDIDGERIIDYVGGFEDAKKNLLKAIGDPKLRYIQDPVRMIRLLKFKARFDFYIDENSINALEICKEEIIKSSQARILEEIFRMLESGSSKTFFSLLERYGFLKLLFPYLEKHLNKNKSIFEYLNKVDEYNLKHINKRLSRSILFSAILYPLFKSHIEEKEKKMHLGYIADEARKTISKTFHDFFLLPRRIKAEMISILTNQFRFTPISKAKGKKIKVPKDPFFYLALNFFKLRSNLDISLIPIYNKWHEQLIIYHKYRKRSSNYKKK